MSDLVQWPARRVQITATHETCGDERFCQMVEVALFELLRSKHGVDKDDFTASNGVTLTLETMEKPR